MRVLLLIRQVWVGLDTFTGRLTLRSFHKGGCPCHGIPAHASGCLNTMGGAVGLPMITWLGSRLAVCTCAWYLHTTLEAGAYVAT